MQDILRSIAPHADEAQRTVGLALRKLLTAAFIDRLTELFNGVALDQLADARDRTPPFGVIFMDLSGFKGINDTHGHEAGNAALREAGKAVYTAAFGVPPETQTDTLRKGLIPFRKSGDEFVIIADSAPAARECARQLAKTFGQGLDVPYEVNGKSVMLPVRGAVGLCIREDYSATLKQLMERADAACRVAKFDQATDPIEWNDALANDEVDSQRKPCPTCRTTTTILFRKSRRKESALSRCGNCGEALD